MFNTFETKVKLDIDSNEMTLPKMLLYYKIDFGDEAATMYFVLNYLKEIQQFHALAV